ncbi:MAG: 3-deoxy-D-manno-octulosonic acid transferase, partial [Bacteroidetes bacterium]|nr:3-deoxy-D-manno-octulosonic acid transferase [Bacteroidota bacterium]
MKSIWSLVYNILFLPALYLLIKFAGLFNNKVRRGIAGRKRLFEELILSNNALNRTGKLVWFHSASLGEFEQAKPIIKKLKLEKKLNILITFFSPSGYDNSRKYPYADLISYLPFDTKNNVDKFVRIVKPDLFVMIRYDIWPNLIWNLKKANIPSCIVDATMKKNSSRALPIIKSFHKTLFGDILRILTISEADAEAFKIFNCDDDIVKVVGDTRFDRVYQKSIIARDKKLISSSVLDGKKVFVAGST